MADLERVVVPGWFRLGFLECSDPDLTRILEVEIADAGLTGKDIRLFVPESDDYVTGRVAGVQGCEAEGYKVFIFPNTLAEEGPTPRRAIRHELAHIKYGDNDRKLPRALKVLYYFFVEEPRAAIYERRGS